MAPHPSSGAATAEASAPGGGHLVPHFNHVGIQTRDLDNSLGWYKEFFGAKESWSLTDFSDLTLSRLPGIRRLVEVETGGLRFHLFERDRADDRDPGGNEAQYQHICLTAESAADLERWRERWTRIHDSGRYTFARPDEATDIVVDEEGVHSFYILDPNALEFEFTWQRGGA